MSFRSRSRTVQPIVTRRASSLTRTIAPPSVNGSSTLGSSYAGRSYTGASAIGSGSYGTSNSPLTSGYSSSPYGGTSSPSSRSLLGSAGGAGAGSTNGSGHYFDYSNLSRRDSYGGSSSSLAYKSPYKDKERYGGGGASSYTPSAGSSASSSYKDRYVSPYTSYDNGITTASLSLSGLKRHHHLSSNGLSTSNTSLNGYVPSASSGSSSYHHHNHTPTTGVGRSQSLRDHERRSRSRTRASQAASSAAALASYPSNSSLARSYSTASVQSEGYETGSERGRSRVGSTASELDTASNQQQQQDSSRENGGDFIDYKALYEQEKADNEKLKMALRKKDEEVVTLKAALDRFTTATTKNNSLSELEKRERRAMERKMSEMEEELKLLQKYKTENERLRAENRALTRVVSKLTTSAQNQMHSNNAAKQ